MAVMRALGVVLGVLLWWTPRAEAACGGSGLTWTCPAGTTSSELADALDAADDGATLTFAAGTYSWDTFVSFSNDRGATLICETAGACSVAASGSVIGMNGTLSGMNTKLYRVSGFTFHDGGNATTIWFYGPGTMTSLRIDHNTFTSYDEADLIILGETSTIASFFGVIDHNTVTNAGNLMLVHMLGAVNPTPSPSPRGGPDNLYVEDNTMTFASITNAGRGCIDGWGGNALVWRHNRTTNCLVTEHGVVHNGGPINVELYENTLAVTGGAGVDDCYRCFHHQGSGELIAFNNSFTPAAGHNGSALAVTHYRSATPADAGYDVNLGRCDGTNPMDGNRAPTATYYGYPCWHQPGRDTQANLQPMYVWNNQWSDTQAKIDLTVENPWGATNPGVEDHIVADRDYYNAVSASAQTSPTAPFDGTTGMGFGPLADRPPTCTTNPLETGGGVGYFAADDGPQGTLYRCSATDTWTVQYKPFTYPHPLVGGGDPQQPDAGLPGDDAGSPPGGCCDTRGAGSSSGPAVLAMLVMLGLRRRRSATRVKPSPPPRRGSDRR